MLDTFIDNLKHPGSTKATNWVDKLNFQLTTITFFSLALLSTLKSYVGDPIDCWTPEYFTTQWIQYVDNICWMRNTYFIPDDMSVGEARDDLNIDWELTYYQWVPIILGLMALTFYVPNFFWHATMKHTININSYVERFREKENETNVRLMYQTFDSASKTLDHYLRQRFLQNEHLRLRPSSCHNFNVFRTYHHNRISIIYIVIKLLYIIIAVMDLWFLSLFFGHEFYYFGVTVSKLLIKNGAKEKMVTSLFPKITLCDFFVREKGNVKTYTVMCVLTINLFTEKIFLIVWTILVANIILTTINFISWCWRLAIPYNRMHCVISSIKRASRRFGVEYDKLSHNRTALEKFVNEYLRSDGVLILRMVEINTSKTVGCAFVRWLYSKFMEEEVKLMEPMRPLGIPNFGLGREDAQGALLQRQPGANEGEGGILGKPVWVPNFGQPTAEPPSYTAANGIQDLQTATLSSQNGGSPFANETRISDEPDRPGGNLNTTMPNPTFGRPPLSQVGGTSNQNRSLGREFRPVPPTPIKRPDERRRLLDSFIDN